MAHVVRARIAIENYKAATYMATFGYECSINPEGISQQTLNVECGQCLDELMVNLSKLTNDGITTLLDAHPDYDFDGCAYPVTSLHEVRGWQQKH